MKTREAIERVTSRFDKWALDEEDLEALRALGLVPESEDERVRKNLISFINLNKNSMFSQTERNEFINYLEKQKEQNRGPIDECNMHELTLDEARKWNEAYEKGYSFGKGYSLGYENGRNDQKPAEWSEEDKRNLTDAISAIEHLKNNCDWGYLGIGNDIDNVLNFLESLPERIQSSWKPSEEQMNALLKLEEMFVLEHETNQENAWLYVVIKSLKEQLLKLRRGEL